MSWTPDASFSKESLLRCATKPGLEPFPLDLTSPQLSDNHDLSDLDNEHITEPALRTKPSGTTSVASLRDMTAQRSNYGTKRHTSTSTGGLLAANSELLAYFQDSGRKNSEVALPLNVPSLRARTTQSRPASTTKLVNMIWELTSHSFMVDSMDSAFSPSLHTSRAMLVESIRYVIGNVVTLVTSRYGATHPLCICRSVTDLPHPFTPHVTLH